MLSSRVRAVVLAVVLGAAFAVVGAPPATAQPVIPLPGGGAVAPPAAPAAPDPALAPTDAAGAAAQLGQVQHDAEALTEQWHAAQDAVAARTAEVAPARAAVAPARAAADAARRDEEGYRTQVDAVALSTFESGRLDTLNALLASNSPQDYLDQMSALATISADQAAALDALTSVVERTRRAQDDADAAAARAQTAADDAARAEQDLAARKRDADRLVDEAEALLRRLSPRQRHDRLGPEVDAPALPSGTGAGIRALRAAAAQLGKDYQWGATGPSTFDCSGLTSFAFRRAGITLPRSSSQQALVGRPVAFDDMQPGDLVSSITPVSHVGIYAGDGKMINAPQTGDSSATRRSTRPPSPGRAGCRTRASSAPLTGGGRSSSGGTSRPPPDLTARAPRPDLTAGRHPSSGAVTGPRPAARPAGDSVRTWCAPCW